MGAAINTPTLGRDWDARLLAVHDQFIALDGGVAEFDEPALRRSWQRCLAAGVSARRERPLQRARSLADVGAVERGVVARVTELLAASVDAARAVVIATDTEGTVMSAGGRAELLPAPWRDLLLEGTLMAEPLIGTSAPTLAAIERRAQTVVGAAHFARAMEPFFCTAVPLRHPAGGVFGALDISGYGALPPIDGLGLLQMAADRIEDELVRCLASAGVMELQPLVTAGTVSRPALVAVNHRGEAVAANNLARRWLQQPSSGRLPLPLALLFGGAVAHIGRTPGRYPAHAIELQMPAGWVVELRYGPPGAAAVGGPQPPAAAGAAVPGPAGPSGAAGDDPAHGAATQATFAQARLSLVRDALAACGGNVTLAARRLGISRNSVYRWLKQVGTEPT